MRIAVLDDYQDAFRSMGFDVALAEHEVVVFREPEKEVARQAARLRGFDALLLTQQRAPLPRALLERLPQLRFVSQTGRQLAHIDLEACRERGVVVSASGGAGATTSTAELTWALVLAGLRHLPQEAERLRRGGWQRALGAEAAGKTLGVYGFGRIGAQVARYGRAFGMRVVVLGREGSIERARGEGFEAATSREAFFAQSDVLSMHVSLKPETRGLVAASDLARMKPTALFVNAARAGLVAPGALAAALRAGRPGFAAVDVFDDEPVLDAADPLLALPNVIATPHLGYATVEAYRAIYPPAVEQLLAFARGAPVNVVT